VDSLSLRLIREIWRSHEPVPSVSVSAITSGSVPAIRAYLRGARFFRLGAFDSAAVALEEAVREDSTFAMADLLLANAYAWIDGHGSARSVAANEAALRHADRLPAREQMMVTAYKLFTSNHPLEAVDTMRAYVARYPTDPNGWAVLGDVQFHVQPHLRLESDQRFEPFNQALALDSSFVSMLMHPLEMAFAQGDTARFHQYLNLIEARSAETRDFPAIESSVWGDSVASRHGFEELTHTRQTAFTLAAETALLQGRLDAVDRAIAVLDSVARAGDPTRRRFALITDAILRLSTGRVVSVGTTADRMASAGLLLASATTRILPIFVGVSDRSLLDKALPVLRDSLPPASVRFVEACVSLANNDGAAAQRLIIEAEAMHGPTKHTPLHLGLRAAARWAEVLRGDTASGVEHMRTALDSLGLWTEIAPGVTANALRLPLARFLAAEPATRSQAIDRLRLGFDSWGGLQYLPLARYELAKALESDGQFDDAAAAYADFITIWARADEPLQTYVDDARRALVRLEQRRG